MDTEANIILRLREHVIALARELNIVPRVLDVSESATPVSQTADWRVRLTTAIAWQRASSLRRKQFDDGDSLFADPAWEILLDLYIHQLQGKPLQTSSACLAACVPATTALRWIDRLEAVGLVTRVNDRRDGRRVHLYLSDEAIERMNRTLDGAIASDRRLGLARLAPIEGIAA